MSGAELTGRVQSGWQGVRRARHLARAPRYLASIFLLIFLGLGVRAALFGATAASAPRPAGEASDLPSQDFALQFARAYLSFDAGHPGLRASALAPYIRGGQLAQGAGLTPGRGRQLVLWAEVASDQPALAGGRVITVAASVSSQKLPLYLAITVEHPRRRPLRLAGYPALVGAPSIAPPAAPPEREPVSDPALSEVVGRVLHNYLAGSARELEADLTADAQVSLPTRRLRLEEVQQLVWLGGPDSGAVLATLSASDSGGATYTFSYELGIAYRERPYVDYIEVVPTDS